MEERLSWVVTALIALLFTIFLLFACGPQTLNEVSNYSSATSKILIANDGGTPQECFLANYGATADAINQKTMEVCGLEKPPTPTVIVLVRGYVPPIPGNAQGKVIDGSKFWLAENTRQLAVFAHEFQRYSCIFARDCCEFGWSSYDWSGVMGVLWNAAETEAYLRCG